MFFLNLKVEGKKGYKISDFSLKKLIHVLHYKRIKRNIHPLQVLKKTWDFIFSSVQKVGHFGNSLEQFSKRRRIQSKPQVSLTKPPEGTPRDSLFASFISRYC